MRIVILAGLLLLSGGLVSRAAEPAVKARVAFPQLHFERPLFLCEVPDGSGELAVVTQNGVIFHFPNRPDVKEARAMLDIRPQVLRSGNEEGMLGLAFHPGFARNRLLYVVYSHDGPRRDRLASFTMKDDGTVDPQSEKVILEVPEPWSNHNGGMIAFGPDGFLYMSLGDGGAGGDPRGNGQNKQTLLGTIIRLDVDHPAGGKPYGIPADNPFADGKAGAPEIYAYGLRNTWRFSFDRETGTLWAGDVGQNKFEEIDIIVKGGNYGWNIREGMHPFKEKPTGDTLIEPIVEYGRNLGVSVTGGYVYRGKAIPGLVGAYLYGDFGFGHVWALRYDQKAGKVISNDAILKVANPASFGEDAAGEVYVCSFDGRIYRLEPAD